MGRLKAWIRAFFGFSRTESNAFLILLPLMVVIIFSEPLYRTWAHRNPDTTFLDDKHELDSMLAGLQWIKKETSSFARTKEDRTVPQEWKKSDPKFTFFDPNRISQKEFEALGLPSFLAVRIDRYRQKGGVFKSKTDLARIYGMDSTWFEKAKSWIVIAPVTSPRPKEPVRMTAHESMDINLADSVDLNAVKGIGPVLSKRIISFREKLGGYNSMGQLREVYGLDTGVVGRLMKVFHVMDDFVPVKLNLNEATLDELMRHPYIRSGEARAIVAYRMQHGKFVTLEQLTELKMLSPEWIEKVTPYLKVD